MLNPTAPVATGPIAVVAEATADEGGVAFAQALDQVEALAGAKAATPVAPAPIEGDGESAAEPLPTEPTPQDLAAWVCALPLPSPPPTPPAAPAAGATARAIEVDGDTATPRAPHKADRSPTPAAAGEAAFALPGNEHPAMLQRRAAKQEPPAECAGPAHKVADAAAAPVTALAASTSRDVSTTSAIEADRAANPLAAFAAATPGMPARSAEAGRPLQTEVRAPVASDEFAPELGARLSVLVRDGIEHAQLRLNPADLGPIEVRIDLDGQRAQVDFSAAHATTRQALQDAVPALAGALREQGLTLTGGGVFEQPREQRGEGSPRDARQAAASKDRSADDARPVITAPRVPRARGVVDIYA